MIEQELRPLLIALGGLVCCERAEALNRLPLEQLPVHLVRFKPRATRHKVAVNRAKDRVLAYHVKKIYRVSCHGDGAWGMCYCLRSVSYSILQN